MVRGGRRHGEDLCENFDALAWGHGDRPTEAQKRRVARNTVVDEHEARVTTDVAVDTRGHRDVVGSRDELRLVTDDHGPEELGLALQVEPVYVVRRVAHETSGQLARTEMRERAEALDLEGTVRDELTSDLHVREGALAEVRSREQTSLLLHGLAVLADVVGCGDDTTGQRVIKGLMETLDNANDCGHVLSSPF